MVELLLPYDGMLLPYDGARHGVAHAAGLRKLARSAPQVASALDRVQRAPTILAAIQTAPEVRQAVSTDLRAGAEAAPLLDLLLEAIRDKRDTVTAVAAIHALGQVPGRAAEVEMTRLIDAAVHGYDAHAIWSMCERDMSPSLMKPLAEAIARGGLAGMHAQQVLARWAKTNPRAARAVLGALETALRDTRMIAARRYLTETVGMVPGRMARQTLERIATDASEAPAVRAEAIASLGDRSGERLPVAVGHLASEGGDIGAAVRRARALKMLRRRGPRRTHHRRDGIKIAQVHLAAILDAEATRAGMGDTGGVATLLPRLGTTLAAQARVHETISIGRGLPGEPASAWPDSERPQTAHRFESVPLEDGEGAAFASAWPSLVATQRGIRAALLASGTPDVIHLRMADPGSLAAANVARELGIAIVFTLAPDPHGPIAAAERSGRLDRRSFAAQDARAALWFRAVLVAQLASEAREVVLFPRPELRSQLRELVGIDLADGPPRHTVVAEGVDTQQADVAAAAIASGQEAPVIRDLRLAIEHLPGNRQGLPLVVSVGRLNDIKGMARVVEAFALDEELAGSANLVIVGGDLDHPSAAEAAELARINTLFVRHSGLRDRVVLLGHRRHAETGLVLAVARQGWAGSVGSNGAYVCGSLKEEFGLAIVEAMAAGLPVVAPLTGGPAAYVEVGITGTLVDTSDPATIAHGIREALLLAADPETAERTRAVVEARFTLGRMARTLAAVYRIAAGTRTLALPVEEGRAA